MVIPVIWAGEQAAGVDATTRTRHYLNQFEIGCSSLCAIVDDTKPSSYLVMGWICREMHF